MTLPVRADLRAEATESLRRGVAFFTTLNVHGGYGYAATPDNAQRWGESPLGPAEVEVQPPGTPAVGESLLRVWQVTGDDVALAGARAAAAALIRGQNRHGGWDHTIDFSDLTNETVSFDDNQTQAAIGFLLKLNREIDDPALAAAVERSIAMMIATQLPNGGWPHRYPAGGDYHDYATFNDGGINDCVAVMILARRLYPDDGDGGIDRSLRQVARFMMISQLPPPQPGWAQQYNEYLQPAWARTFEPPAVCPAVTVRNLETLIDLWLELGDETLLEPIPDSLRWLRESRLPNGKWARFVEIGTGKALYYDRGRVRVDSVTELHPERRTGYGYETDLSGHLAAVTARFEAALELGRKGLRARENTALAESDERTRARLEVTVRRIIADQEASGAWISREDRFKKVMPRGVRWNGEYEQMDRVRSAVFNRNVALLCDYLELTR